MCSIKNKTELEKKIEEIRKYKAMAEKQVTLKKALEAGVIFLYE